MVPLVVIDFGGTGRAAEVADGATAAGFKIFDFSVGDLTERRGGQDIGQVIGKKIAALEFRQADEFAAREEIAGGGHGKEAAPAAAGRDITHQAPGRGRGNTDEDIGEVGNDQAAPGLLIKLPGAVQGRDKMPGQTPGQPA